MPGPVAERAAIRRQPRGPDPAGPRRDVALGARDDRGPSRCSGSARARSGPGTSTTDGPRPIRPEHRPPPQLGDPDRRRAGPSGPRSRGSGSGSSSSGRAGESWRGRSGRHRSGAPSSARAWPAWEGSSSPASSSTTSATPRSPTVVLALMAQPWVVAREMAESRMAGTLLPDRAELASRARSAAASGRRRRCQLGRGSRLLYGVERGRGGLPHGRVLVMPGGVTEGLRRRCGRRLPAGPVNRRRSGGSWRPRPCRGLPRARESRAGRTGRELAAPSSASRPRTPVPSPRPGAASPAVSQATGSAPEPSWRAPGTAEERQRAARVSGAGRAPGHDARRAGKRVLDHQRDALPVLARRGLQIVIRQVVRQLVTQNLSGCSARSPRRSRPAGRARGHRRRGA